MLNAGIAWHHSGMTHNLKSIVESLFRIGEVKIVIATATLALGVHMPCKTVVFMSDEIYLDSFQYRQASGRAGRRGYDKTGNIVFFDIPFAKVERLISSNVAEMRPHFPLSVTFAMQLFDCVLKTNKAENISIDSVLNKSFWNYSYKSKIKQVGYNAIFSIHFLYQLKLINDTGKFSTFANLLERIHYHEPSNFVLYYLLINNVFHELIKTMPMEAVEIEVMTIMCHFFNQHPIRNTKHKSIVLPKLSQSIQGKITEYNDLVGY